MFSYSSQLFNGFIHYEPAGCLLTENAFIQRVCQRKQCVLQATWDSVNYPQPVKHVNRTSNQQPFDLDAAVLPIEPHI